MRGLDQPGIPMTEFEPRPLTGVYGAAQYGVVIRDRLGGTYETEVFGPDDVQVQGRPLDWRRETNGTGVIYARAYLFGVPVAIARAVPLS